VLKGAILRKDQRVKVNLCKFSESREDSVFQAILYSSDSDKTLRYSDDPEASELCRWTVDLSSLPTFQKHAVEFHPGGFYTDFELGLELDSAEVRGVLLYNGQDWGQVVFDHFS